MLPGSLVWARRRGMLCNSVWICDQVSKVKWVVSSMQFGKNTAKFCCSSYNFFLKELLRPTYRTGAIMLEQTLGSICWRHALYYYKLPSFLLRKMMCAWCIWPSWFIMDDTLKSEFGERILCMNRRELISVIRVHKPVNLVSKLFVPRWSGSKMVQVLRSGSLNQNFQCMYVHNDRGSFKQCE